MNNIRKIIVSPSYQIANTLCSDSNANDVLVLTRVENLRGYNLTTINIRSDDVVILFGEEYDYPENTIRSSSDYHNFKQLVEKVWTTFKSDTFVESLK